MILMMLIIKIIIIILIIQIILRIIIFTKILLILIFHLEIRRQWFINYYIMSAMIPVCTNKNSPPFNKISQFSIISEDFRKLETVKDKLDYDVHEDFTICGQDPIMVNNIKHCFIHL